MIISDRLLDGANPSSRSLLLPDQNLLLLDCLLLLPNCLLLLLRCLLKYCLFLSSFNLLLLEDFDLISAFGINVANGQ